MRRRRARVGRDLPGVDVQADSADQQPSGRRPPVRAVGGDGDLRAIHVDRVGPLGLSQAVEQSPQPGQRPDEVAGVGARPDPSGPRRGRERGQRPGQQLGGMTAGVLVTGNQVRGQHRRGLRPGDNVRAPAALSLVCAGHPTFLGSVDLHVGGIQIDGG